LFPYTLTCYLGGRQNLHSTKQYLQIQVNDLFIKNRLTILKELQGASLVFIFHVVLHQTCISGTLGGQSFMLEAKEKVLPLI
jgi:hypothetical protein